MIHLEAPEHTTEATFREQLASYENRKLFDPVTYDSPVARQQLDSLIRLIGQLQARGARVVVVVMPEHSDSAARAADRDAAVARKFAGGAGRKCAAGVELSRRPRR